ncbi:MAG: CDP-alcohol phosphatidyltransferase family protein [Halobacteriales archaeon]
MLDQFDGQVARSVGQETLLGRRLDLGIDTLGFVVAPAVAVAWGQLPVWYLSLSAARYVYRGLKRLRRLRGGQLHERPDSNLGRYLADGQMAFLTVVLTPLVSPAMATAVAPFALALSVSVFLRDYTPGRDLCKPCRHKPRVSRAERIDLVSWRLTESRPGVYLFVAGHLPTGSDRIPH